MINPFELHKERLLFFSPEPPDQIFAAYILLVGLENFHVEMGPHPNCLRIRYSIKHYSLEALEKALKREGFKLETRFIDKIKNQLIHYCEDVQYHNLKTHVPRTKNNAQEIFVKAYELHPHGDHDDTPKDLREAK